MELLTEAEREELLAEVTDAHDGISKVLSELRRRYSAKLPAVKAAAKAERDLFQLKRQIEKMDLQNTGKDALPTVTQGGKGTNLDDLL